MKYRKKPVVVDAVRWHGTDDLEIAELCMELGNLYLPIERNDRSLIVSTLEGQMVADPGDYIIKGVKGEVYPCKPDIFEATYEKVEESDGWLNNLARFFRRIV